MIRILHLSIYLIILANFPSYAQLSEKGVPPSFGDASLEIQNMERMILPAIPSASVNLEDEKDAINGVPPRFGYPYDVNLSLHNAGTWTSLSNGDRVWQLGIECPGALSINLLYEKFYMPKGAKFFIYNKERNHVIGAFTSKNNKLDGRFGTGLVFGDKIVLEYYEPKVVKGKGHLQVSTIVHGYRYINHEGLARDYGSSGPCQVDVNCTEGTGRSDQIKSVALMLIGGIRWCTGTLINNIDEDCRPLFLTSNTCLSTYDAIDNPKASGFSFYWRYESPTCGGVDGPINQSTSGATVLANSSTMTGSVMASDFALLELDENPADSYDVYFAGWDAANITPSDVYIVHHPVGDVKKIAEDKDALFESGFAGAFGTTHWTVFQWDTGVMEDGSTGAPLFLSTNGRIVGQHSGGLSNCGLPYEDYYGKFAYSWLNNGASDPRRRLKDWLDPSKIGTTAIDGTYSPCNPRPIVSLAAASASVRENPVASIDCLDYQEITVDLEISAAPQVDVTVNLNLGGTATAGLGEDYFLTPSSVVFPAGSSAPIPLTIRVYDDAYIESSENFEITYTLSTTGRAVSSCIENEFRATIADNDLPPSLNGPVNTYYILSEDFEDGGFPSDWTKSTLGDPAQSFKWGKAEEIGDASTFFTVNPSNATNMVGSNDDVCNCNMSEDYLFSPIFDLSSVTYGRASVVYDVYFEGLSYQGFNEYAKVFATTNGGSTWQEVDNIPGVGADGPWQTRIADLSDFFGSSNVQLRFSYDDTGGFLFGVAYDNIRVEVEDRLPTDIRVPENPTSMAEEYLGPFESVFFYDEVNGNLMAKIENTSAHDYGCTSVMVDRSGMPLSASQFSSQNSAYYLASKTFSVTPTNNNANGSYNITLYYTEAEIAGWEAFTGQTRTNARIIKANTAIRNITPTSYNNYLIEDQTQTMTPYINSLGEIDQGFTATFSSGFSGFGLGLVDANLPVTIISFEGHRRGNKAILTWETETEINNDYFTLERSNNGTHFEEIAEISGAGTSISPTKYEYTDYRPVTGNNYYRLSQADFSGILTEIDVVLVEFEDLSNLEISPNPVHTQMEVAFLHHTHEGAMLEIYDMTGRMVQVQGIEAFEGTNTAIIDMSSFAPGVYFLRLQLGFVVKTREFIKQ